MSPVLDEPRRSIRRPPDPTSSGFGSGAAAAMDSDSSSPSAFGIGAVVNLTDASPRQRVAVGDVPVRPTLPVAARFAQLAHDWYAATGNWSSPSKRYMHASYQRIIGLGPDVVPVLLRDLPHDWFYALWAITGQNPIQPADRGNIHAMARAWRQWGASQGHLG